MATLDQVLKLIITADGRGLSAGLTRATGELRNFGTTAQRNLQAVATSFRTLGALAGVSFAGLGAREIIATADSYRLLETRIKGATAETNDYAAVSAQLRDIAKSTGTELEQTVSVFQSLVRSRTDLGATNAEMLKLTRLVQQLGVLGGASTSALQNGLLQFSQAMSEGIVRAEEFNSILTNLPELAKAIREGLGKSNAELRQMVKSGQLLSKDVFDALIKQSASIEERFAKIPTTAARGWNALKIEVVDLVGRLNESLKLTEAIGQAAQAVADRLKVSREDVLDDLEKQEAKLKGLIDQFAAWERKRAAAPYRSINPFVDTKEDIGKMLDRNLQSIMETEEEIGRLNKQLLGMQQAGELAATSTGSVAKGVEQIGATSAAATKELSNLQKTYAALVQDIKAGAKAAAAGPVKDVKQSTVLDINRLYDQAQRALEQGDAESGERLIEQARQINDYLLETKQVTQTYYQAQAARLLKLAEQGQQVLDGTPLNLPVAPDLDGAKASGALLWEAAQDAINAKGPLTLPAGVAQVGETSFADAAATGIDVPLTLDATPATAALPGVTADLQAQIKPIVQPVVLATTPGGQGITSYADLQAEFNRQQGLATGGLVSGPGTSTSDSILARVSNKEYVVKAKSVESVGVRILDYINRFGKLPQFNLGGLVSAVSALRPPSFNLGGLIDAVSALRVPRFNAGGLVPVPAVPRFANGGPVGTPVNLYLPGGQSFGLTATPSVARELASILGAEVLKRGRR